MDNSVAAEKFSRQTERTCRILDSPGALRRKSDQIGSGNFGWKNFTDFGRKLADFPGIWSVLAEGRFAGAVVDAFAEAFKVSLARQA